MNKEKLQKLFTNWTKETGRNGGVLIGSSIKDFFQYIEDNVEEPKRDISINCCYCGEGFGYGLKLMTCDHLIPLSRGGTNTHLNKRNCCRECNTQKSDKTPERFLCHVLDKLSALKKIKSTTPGSLVAAKIYRYEGMIENIKYICEYVYSVGEPLFKNKYFYDKYIEERGIFYPTN